MPLPRPLGEPFARPAAVSDDKSGTQDESKPSLPLNPPPKKKRAVAPITAGAFSFQLGTPIKRETNHDVEDKRRIWSPMGMMPSTPMREISATPRPTSKIARPLTSLPSPFGGLKTPTVKMEKQGGSGTGTRLSEMQAPSAKALGKRRAPDFDLVADESAPAGSPVRPMKALGQLGQVHFGESLHQEEIKKRVEEEGIGVSPRGKKIIKYSGKGPPPLSFTLSNALSAQQSSLVLFYASMQSTLFPSRTPKKSRMTPSALTEGALQPATKGPTILQHLRSAPLVVHVKEVIKGRTGYSVMCRCEVVKGRIDQTDLASRSTTDANPISEDGQSTRIITLVLHALPPECTRLGLDPRIMALKPPTSSPAATSAAYEIGIWPPWTDTDFDSTITETDENHKDKEKDATCDKVVFASRYLLADSSSPHHLL